MTDYRNHCLFTEKIKNGPVLSLQISKIFNVASNKRKIIGLESWKYNKCLLRDKEQFSKCIDYTLLIIKNKNIN